MTSEDKLKNSPLEDIITLSTMDFTIFASAITMSS